MPVVQCVLPGAETHTSGQDFLITPGQVQSRMNLHQKPDENGHEQTPRHNMTTDDIQAEIGQKDEAQTFGDGKAVRDLRVDLGMFVMTHMNDP